MDYSNGADGLEAAWFDGRTYNLEHRDSRYIAGMYQGEPKDIPTVVRGCRA